ncbi:MAG TPA: class I SAM-dependent methyltransferase [Actinopolymorphaceae bacterium]|nr:class I SAM-dependent methyltransferase [Actinopolymorphaceae bacterium]
MDTHTSVNQKLWDELAPLHAASRHYAVDAFVAGADTLGAVELFEVGDVSGKRLVHLMCHFGMDTLSWARRGAQVTGVDFSSEAIRIARELTARVRTPAEFVCSDVLLAADVLADTFDIVFLSRGVLMWIEDIDAWARVCARLLRPGGVFYLLDNHPLALAVTETADGIAVGGSYFHSAEPVAVVQDGSYAVTDPGMRHQESREWTHSLGEVVTALVGAGIRIEFLHEFPGEVTATANSEGDTAPHEWSEDASARHQLPGIYSVRGVRM